VDAWQTALSSPIDSSISDRRRFNSPRIYDRGPLGLLSYRRNQKHHPEHFGINSSQFCFPNIKSGPLTYTCRVRPGWWLAQRPTELQRRVCNRHSPVAMKSQWVEHSGQQKYSWSQPATVHDRIQVPELSETSRPNPRIAPESLGFRTIGDSQSPE